MQKRLGIIKVWSLQKIYQNMERILKTLIYILLGSSILGALSYYVDVDFYQGLVKEDGVFETLTALVLLVISILSLIRLIKQHKQRNKWWVLMNVLIVLGAFFGFGEEISWGQRIFSIQAGDFFTSNNLQHETNLHNLEVGGVNINKLIFSKGLVVVFGFYFLFSQWLYIKWSRFKKFILKIGLQLPKVKHSVAIFVCTGIVVASGGARIWELWEAMFVLVILWVFIDPFNTDEKLLKGTL